MNSNRRTEQEKFTHMVKIVVARCAELLMTGGIIDFSLESISPDEVFDQEFQLTFHLYCAKTLKKWGVTHKLSLRIESVSQLHEANWMLRRLGRSLERMQGELPEGILNTEEIQHFKRDADL